MPERNWTRLDSLFFATLWENNMRCLVAVILLTFTDFFHIDLSEVLFLVCLMGLRRCSWLLRNVWAGIAEFFVKSIQMDPLYGVISPHWFCFVSIRNRCLFSRVNAWSSYFQLPGHVFSKRPDVSASHGSSKSPSAALPSAVPRCSSCGASCEQVSFSVLFCYRTHSFLCWPNSDIDGEDKELQERALLSTSVRRWGHHPICGGVCTFVLSGQVDTHLSINSSRWTFTEYKWI